MNGQEQPILTFRGPWGIPVEIGGSIAFLGVLLVLVNPGNFVAAMTFFVILVGSIFLHEMGHAWGALVQGVPVRRIVIFGGGGFCEHARSVSPRQDEFIVAMGPIVNLTIWAVASLIAPSVGSPIAANLLALTATLNLFLAIFNLLPLMPLDGGRLFYLAMLRLLPPQTATRVAGAVGLLGVVLWIPLMFYVLYRFGFILIFFPPVRLHWRMFQEGRR